MTRCPACRARVRCHPDDAHTEVECPVCREVFTPDPDRDAEVDAVLARAAVRGPANGLLWTGAGGMVLLPLLGAGYAAIGVVLRDQPRAAGDPPPELFYVIGAIVAAIGFPYFAVMAVAAHKMKELRGTGWGYTAAGLGVATVVVWGPCLPVAWAGVPYGVMAMIALSKPAVRDTVRRQRGDSRNEGERWN